MAPDGTVTTTRPSARKEERMSVLIADRAEDTGSSVRPAVRRHIGTTWNQRHRLALAQRPGGWHKPPVCFGLYLSGPVRENDLVSALTTVARRHTALRSVFPVSAAGRFGVCVDEAAVRWGLRRVDLRGHAAAERAAREADVLRALQATFAPDEYPLFRGFLLQYDNEWLLALSIDHLVFDGASVQVFLDEFGRAYRTAMRFPGDVPAGSDVALFSDHERDWLAGAEAGEAFEYWRGVWSGFGPFPRTDLPLLSPGSGGRTSGLWRCALSPVDVQRRRQTACPGHITLPTFAAGAVLAALRDVTGQAECGLLYPSSRRIVPGARQMIGYLNNRMLLRVDTPRRYGAGQILAATRAAMLDSLEHQMLPFEALIERFAPDLGASKPNRPYLFVNVQSRPVAPELPAVSATFCWLGDDGARDDLSWISVDLDDTADEVVLTARYSRSFFADDMVAELMSRVTTHLTDRAETVRRAA
jgi:condensation domain-containing protein